MNMLQKLNALCSEIVQVSDNFTSGFVAKSGAKFTCTLKGEAYDEGGWYCEIVATYTTFEPSKLKQELEEILEDETQES